jgi:hypothetical protein
MYVSVDNLIATIDLTENKLTELTMKPWEGSIRAKFEVLIGM